MSRKNNIFSEKTIKCLVYIVLFFNIVDIVVTIRFIKHGNYNENNPFMKLFLDMDGVMPFIFIKSFLICAGCYFLYKYREKIMAQLGIYMCFCFYWALICQFYYFLYLK